MAKDELTKNLYAALTEVDEWATPADLLRSLHDVGLDLCTAAERDVLEAMPTELLGIWASYDSAHITDEVRAEVAATLARRGGTSV